MRGTGGCDFAARPSRSGLHQPIHWTPDADPALVVLAKPPDGPTTLEPIPLDLFHVSDAAEGRYARHRKADGDVPILLLPDAPADLAAAALVLVTADTPDRIDALGRFWRAGRGLDAPDTRLTLLQRRRIPRALRAADARSLGASYREIASALRGSARLAAEADWRSSPLRTEAIELVKAATALIAGGYLDLLRHRRRS